MREPVVTWGLLWSRRQLLDLLVRRDIRAKYKNSALGLIWSLVRPLTQLGIFYVVMGMFLGLRHMVPHFAIFVFTGLSCWSLFQEIVTSGTGSVLANSGIVKKTRLPVEVFPLASVGSALFNCCIQLAILLIAVLVTGGFPRSNPGLFPLAILVVLVWGTALALLLSALNVYYRDVQYLTDIVLMIGFYASPIIYSWSLVTPQVPLLVQDIYLANPITLAVLGMQSVFWDSAPEQAYPPLLVVRLLTALGVGLIALMLCHRVFARLQRNFAQEL